MKDFNNVDSRPAEAIMCIGHHFSVPVLQPQRDFFNLLFAMTSTSTRPSQPWFPLSQSPADGKFGPGLDKPAVQADRPDHRLAEAQKGRYSN